jgi:hypothetical protein
MNADAVQQAAEAREKRSRHVMIATAMAWPVGAVMLLAAAADPATFDPTANQYGMNWPGDLGGYLWNTAVEAGVLVLLLRPWSFRDSIGRLVLALLLFVPWALFSLVVGMHGGPISNAHELWLLLVCAGLVAGLIMTVRGRRNPSSSIAPHTAEIQQPSR